MQKNITAKFGGSSLATAKLIRQAVDIINFDKRRRYVVVSAPGKRNSQDRRITDLLYECSRRTNQYLSFDSAFSIIEKRFIDIGIELKISIVPKLLDEVYTGIRSKRGQDWIVSRGEWIMAQIIAEYMGGVFVDAGDIICLEENGEINSKTTNRMKKFLSKDLLYVIPGFYGKNENGEVKVFPRGGSDITGALVAKYMHCELYENWTDVDGVYTAQPNLVPQAKPLQSLTFQEMRELGYRGAEVIHKDALLPLIKLGVPIEVKNTFKPKSKGTLIVSERQVGKDELIIGIAGRGGFTSIQLQKYGLNDQKGIIEKITLILKKHSVSFEHNPTGLDSVSIIVAKEAIVGREKDILRSLEKNIEPDHLSMRHQNLALLCLVGEGLIKNPLAHTKTAAIIFKTLYDARVQIHAIISATAGIDIVVAIDEKDLDKALNKLHSAFFG